MNAYGVRVSEECNVDKLKETLQILKDEKEFLEKYKDTEFTFLGYIMDEERELPKFFYNVYNEDGSISYATATTPFTPKTFSHCMKHLEDSEKLRLMDNFDGFKDMYYQISKSAKYQEEDWSQALLGIRQRLKFDNSFIMRELSSKVTEKDLRKVDWDSFGAEIKPYLAPSYHKKPQSVDISRSKHGNLIVKLKMCSKTSPSYRSILINGNDVSQAINSEVAYEYNNDMSQIWRKYRRGILINYATDVKDKKDVSVM